MNQLLMNRALEVDSYHRQRPQKIPVTIITGFLGSGKTSLITHLLAHLNGIRVALIINEFGDVGVDGQLVPSGCCAKIIELDNGCLCCVVADEFLPAMQSLIEQDNPPEHIIIETSGLALPKPLLKAFQWPDMRSKVTVDGVISVLDAYAIEQGRFADQEQAGAEADHDNPLEELFEDQLACADMVLLNKTDLVTPDGLSEVTAQIKARLTKGVQIIPIKHGQIEPNVVLDLMSAAENDLESRPSHHDDEPEHDHDDFTSFVIALGEINDIEAFKSKISAAINQHDILRLKGFVAIKNKNPRLILQCVGGRIQHYYDRIWRADEKRQTKLVVIGQASMDPAAITQLITA